MQKRFKFPENSLELYAEKVQYRGLSAIAQCESLRYKLLGGLAVRRYVTDLYLQNESSISYASLVLAMVSSVSSWSPAPRVARSLSLASSVLPVLSR